MNNPLAGFRPDHAGISVADLEASISWYGEMLGFTVDRIVDIPEDTGRLALIRNGDFLLELFCLPDLRALMEHLKARSADVVWDMVVHDDTLCAFVRDNSGNVVEFVER